METSEMKDARMAGARLCPAGRMVLLILCSVSWLSTAQGEIYKWVDASGRVQFSDRPPASADAQRVQLGRINTYEGVSVGDEADDRPSVPSPAGSRGVVMYGASWCGVCERARRFFRDQGIPFREHDVERDEAARRELERMKGTGVPIILVRGKRMNGFSERRFMDLYSR